MNWKRNPLLVITSAFQLFHARSVERHQETYSSLKGDYAELWNASIFFIMSVRLRGTTWIALDKLLCNIISEYIQKIWREEWRNSTIVGASIATGYGLDGRGSKPGGRRNFPHLFIPTKGPTQPPVQKVPVFPVSKGGQGVTFTTNPNLVPSSSKSRVIPLYTFCAVWPATGWNVT